eukprot:11771045-Karenia_brevis.AAC.1
MEVTSWALGAVRVLQKDVSFLLPVVSDLAKRMTMVENEIGNGVPFLELPPVQPGLRYVDVESLEQHKRF